MCELYSTPSLDFYLFQIIEEYIKRGELEKAYEASDIFWVDFDKINRAIFEIAITCMNANDFQKAREFILKMQEDEELKEMLLETLGDI